MVPVNRGTLPLNISRNNAIPKDGEIINLLSFLLIPYSLLRFHLGWSSHLYTQVVQTFSHPSRIGFRLHQALAIRKVLC
jgi:hypothetical protein